MIESKPIEYITNTRAQIISDSISFLTAEGNFSTELVVIYQPKYDLTNDCLSGFEALARWKHLELGLIKPGEFIHHFERSAVTMRFLTRSVLEKVISDLSMNVKEGFNYPIAVNISANDLLDPEFVPFLLSTLLSYKVNTHLIEIEITESSFLLDKSGAINTISKLKQNGIKVSIDDFGTGYSSFAYLNDLPVSYIKLDAKFSRNLNSPKTKMITDSIIKLAAKLGLDVVAEGVEDSETLSILKSLSCPKAQGFLLGKPTTRSLMKSLHVTLPVS